jgi:hypothetical protein
MKSLTNTQIIDNSAASIYDRAAQQDKASERSDRLRRDTTASVGQAVTNINDQRKKQSDALNAATLSVGQLQAKAHYKFQDEINEEINKYENFIANYEGDKTLQAFQGERMRMEGRIKNMNARSSGIISAATTLKTEVAEDPRYNKAGIYTAIDDLTDNPESLGNYASVNEQLDEIKRKNLNMRAIAKEKLSKFGVSKLKQSGRTKDGLDWMRDQSAHSIFSFDREGQLKVDITDENIYQLKREDPEFVKQLLTMAKESVDEQVITDSTMTEDDLIKDQLGRLYTEVESSMYASEYKNETEATKIANETANRKNKEKEPAETVDWGAQYSRYFAAIATGNIGNAAAESSLTVDDELEIVTKESYLQSVTEKLAKGLASGDIKKDVHAKLTEFMEKKAQNIDPKKIMEIRLNGKSYAANEQQIKALFIRSVNSSYTSAKDRKMISAGVTGLNKEALEQGNFATESLLSNDETFNAIMKVIEGDKTSSQKNTAIMSMLNTDAVVLNEGTKAIKNNGGGDLSAQINDELDGRGTQAQELTDELRPDAKSNLDYNYRNKEVNDPDKLGALTGGPIPEDQRAKPKPEAELAETNQIADFEKKRVAGTLDDKSKKDYLVILEKRVKNDTATDDDKLAVIDLKYGD